MKRLFKDLHPHAAALLRRQHERLQAIAFVSCPREGNPCSTPSKPNHTMSGRDFISTASNCQEFSPQSDRTFRSRITDVRVFAQSTYNLLPHRFRFTLSKSLSAFAQIITGIKPHRLLVFAFCAQGSLSRIIIRASIDGTKNFSKRLLRTNLIWRTGFALFQCAPRVRLIYQKKRSIHE